jgi:cytoskeletal protein RodZ
VSIGEALEQARRQAGLTVTEVSQQTRIRETIIRGIEHDDYSSCGGDFYARGHIRSIARAAGVDPEPLIAEYDAANRAPYTMTAAEAFEPVRPVSPVRPVRPARPVGPRKRPTMNWTMVLVIALALVLGFLVYHFLASAFAANPHNAAVAGKAAAGDKAHARQHHPRSAPAAAQSATHASPTSSPSPTPTPAPTPSPHAQALTPASAMAFGPGGQGDNPEHAALAIDHSPASAWHSDWYTTPRFGGLQQGTGLLVRLGHPETITAAYISLGGAPGASVELRVGDAPSLAGLSPVARAAGASGTVSLRPASRAHGRYVLIWFTRLPPDSAGTFQVSVHDIRLVGYP